MPETPDRAEYGVGILGGRRIPLIEPTPENNLARFQPKITSGDYTHDSDDLLSVWAQASWLAGGQAFKVNASSQAERWWDSNNMDTEQRGMLSLRLKMFTSPRPAGATGSFVPLGDYAGEFYGAWDTMLAIFTGSAWVDTGLTFSAAPVARGQVYKTLFYVPLGSGGLDVFDGVGNTVTAVQDATPANINTQSCLVWDNKLVVMDTDGNYRTWDKVAPWTGVLDNYAIPDGSTPRHLQDFIDEQKYPTVYLVTSRGLWKVDPVSDKLTKMGAYYPPHPTQALASCVWRNTDMFISVGIGVHQWNTDVFSAMGLDRDDGLRAELRGYITDLYPEYNGMFALVQGDVQEGDGNDLNLEGGQNYDDPLEFPSQRAVSSLWRYNGYGWHKIWESPGATGSPSWCCLSAKEDGTRYSLFWGYGSEAWELPLRIAFYNPQQGVKAGLDNFQSSGWLRTGRWNANMPAWPKLASHLDVNILDGSTGTVTVEYMTDQTNENWVSLGQATNVGRTTFHFGDDYVGFDGEVYDCPVGIKFDWIEFRYTFDGDGSATSTPLVDAFVFKFIKVPLSTYSWTLKIPIDFSEEYYDVGPRELSDWLSELAATEAFMPFIFKNKSYRVVVAQSTASKYSGDSTMSRFDLVLLEVS